MKKETYKIQGMHCASCVATIERTLKKVPGVNDAVVNFASETALVDYDESTVDSSSLAKAVVEVGYHLMPKESAKENMSSHDHMPGMEGMGAMNHSEHTKAESTEEVKDMKRKLVLGGILSIFIFLGSFPEWFVFVPEILKIGRASCR